MDGCMSPSPELETLWEESSARLRAWFERRTGSASDADDLVQETFVRVHERLDTLLDAASVRAWVGTIARNVLRDHQRRRGTRAGAEAGAVDPQELAGPDADDVPLERTVASWLEDQMCGLDAEDAEALRLVDLEGLTQRELAERAGIGLSAAKSRVQRARTRLRERLEACCAFAFDARGGIVGYEQRRKECTDEGCG
jgi:RNA polymerase sigma-70 factor (ECF subfamily)